MDAEERNNWNSSTIDKSMIKMSDVDMDRNQKRFFSQSICEDFYGNVPVIGAMKKKKIFEHLQDPAHFLWPKMAVSFKFIC